MLATAPPLDCAINIRWILVGVEIENLATVSFDDLKSDDEKLSVQMKRDVQLAQLTPPKWALLRSVMYSFRYWNTRVC